ncbi:MAG: transposase [Planctomycetaceae bacterium]|nr:transposase [Planctomycetaceae bacterium]
MDTAAASLGGGTVVWQDGEDFAIDWDQKWARCPRGRLSVGWKEYTDADRSPYVSIRFSASDCRDCPARPRCTYASKQGRHLKVPTEAKHAALWERYTCSMWRR